MGGPSIAVTGEVSVCRTTGQPLTGSCSTRHTNSRPSSNQNTCR